MSGLGEARKWTSPSSPSIGGNTPSAPPCREDEEAHHLMHSSSSPTSSSGRQKKNRGGELLYLTVQCWCCCSGFFNQQQRFSCLNIWRGGRAAIMFESPCTALRNKVSNLTSRLESKGTLYHTKNTKCTRGRGERGHTSSLPQEGTVVLTEAQLFPVVKTAQRGSKKTPCCARG